MNDGVIFMAIQQIVPASGQLHVQLLVLRKLHQQMAAWLLLQDRWSWTQDTRYMTFVLQTDHTCANVL